MHSDLECAITATYTAKFNNGIEMILRINSSEDPHYYVHTTLYNRRNTNKPLIKTQFEVANSIFNKTFVIEDADNKNQYAIRFKLLHPQK